ncbi:MAG TPA: GNAT family N-acetyltransferase [Terriglobales bacterium]|nr:GNAT family N-acetyltransferase [Terriglobales bacterium]
MKEKLELRILHDIACIAQLLPEWNELWQRCPYATTFQRPEWLFSWMEIFQPAAPVFVEARSAGRLVALIPLLIYERESQQVLALMGGGVSDYLDVLVDPELTEPVLRQVQDFLVEQVSGWDILEFTDLSCNSPLLDAWPNMQSGEPHDACPVLPLGAAGESLTEFVPAHKLRNLRNARRRLDRAGGGELEVANTASINRLLEEMIRLHESRWEQTSQPGVLSDPRVQRFHRRVAPLLLSRGVLRLYALRFKSHYIAALYAFFEANAAYGYLQGYDSRFRELSPGTQILGAVIEDAARLGLSKVDFLRGREEYKYAWGARDEQTFRVHQERSAIVSTAHGSRVAA